MARFIEAGDWKGARIRTARKAGRCDYWRGLWGRCQNQIEAGETYFDGEMAPDKAGGFGRDRYCLEHIGEGIE